eukprot:scaffold4420_cov187-Amphora_coffeaeformis.AAC.3
MTQTRKHHHFSSSCPEEGHQSVWKDKSSLPCTLHASYPTAGRPCLGEDDDGDADTPSHEQGKTFRLSPAVGGVYAPICARVDHPNHHHIHGLQQHSELSSNRTPTESKENDVERQRHQQETTKRRVVVIGAGWGGLSAAHTLAKDDSVKVTVIEASPRVGGLVRDGFTTLSGQRPAEAGQHGFWFNYHNIFRLMEQEIDDFDKEKALTAYAKQGQYSPRGLEAVWPVYQEQPVQLPTGLAQAVFTQFLNLPLADKLSAFPLVLAFSEFDDSELSWRKYDAVSFRDLCIRLGVSRRCYQEAFEPMILTGLFAPGAECSAAAALGMGECERERERKESSHESSQDSQAAFDVQWCRGNIGETIFQPWVKTMEKAGVEFACSTRVTGCEVDKESKKVKAVKCKLEDGSEQRMEAEDVVFAVGAKALNAFATYCPELSGFDEFRRFGNLRGTSVLATRVFLDRNVTVTYSANACWGFDEGVGMTVFDIRALHGDDADTVNDAPGSVIEVDYYHANQILLMNDNDIVAKVKADLNTILGIECERAKVVDAAIVRLPEGINWYFPGSYKYMPKVKSTALDNVFFAGDIVRTRHGSWSQEKAYVTGVEAANLILRRDIGHGVLPVAADEVHVKFGKDLFAFARSILSGRGSRSGPSLVDFLF